MVYSGIIFANIIVCNNFSSLTYSPMHQPLWKKLILWFDLLQTINCCDKDHLILLPINKKAFFQEISEFLEKLVKKCFLDTTCIVMLKFPTTIMSYWWIKYGNWFHLQLQCIIWYQLFLAARLLWRRGFSHNGIWDAKGSDRTTFSFVDLCNRLSVSEDLKIMKRKCLLLNSYK